MDTSAETSKKNRRKRPHTKLVRSQLKSKLEAAILSQKPQILELFQSDEKDNNFRVASLPTVIEKLGLKDSTEVKKLSPYGLRSISNITKVFSIDGPDNELKIRFHVKKRENLEDTIVYVDNLPATCSADRLRRRASVFGTVVNVHIPKPKRLTNRFNRMVHNVGYGFVQFATVKAAKRFIFKYASNSHLRRHKHSRARRRKLAKDPKNRDKRASSEGLATNIDISTQESEATEQLPETPSSVSAENSFEFEYAIAIASTGEKTTRKMEKMIVRSASTSSKVSTDFVRSVSVEEYRERKMTEVSESGNDTDLDIVEKKRKKRARKKRRRGPPAMSLTKMLKKIQVFPLKQYKELRAEYLNLKKERMSVLKKIVAEEREKLILSQDKNGQEKKPEEPKPERAQNKRSRKRKQRPSGKERLMKRAFKIKDLKFSQIPVVDQEQNV